MISMQGHVSIEGHCMAVKMHLIISIAAGICHKIENPNAIRQKYSNLL